MLYRVKKRFYREFRAMEAGDIIELSKREENELKGYVERYKLLNDSDTGEGTTEGKRIIKKIKSTKNDNSK